DSLAAALLGEQAGPLLGYHRAHPAHDVLAVARAMATTRSRFTEERLAVAAGGPGPVRRGRPSGDATLETGPAGRGLDAVRPGRPGRGPVRRDRSGGRAAGRRAGRGRLRPQP